MTTLVNMFTLIHHNFQRYSRFFLTLDSKYLIIAGLVWYKNTMRKIKVPKC